MFFKKFFLNPNLNVVLVVIDRNESLEDRKMKSTTMLIKYYNVNRA